MANEGIMAMPQGAAIPGEMPRDQRPTVTSAQSYDAAQTALRNFNPQEYEILKEALRQNIGDIEFTPRELATFIEIVEYMSQNPSEYSKIRKGLIEKDFAEPDDLPEDYDPEFIGAMMAVLQELQSGQSAGAQAPMMDMPPVEGADAMQGLNGGQPMTMAEGGLADVAAYLASQGRNGDSILAHITPGEARLLQSRGGSGSINPATGLPEFFLKKFFSGVTKTVKKVLASPVGRILATVALAAVLGPAGIGLSMSTAAGLAGAGTSLLAGSSIKEALVAGAMGYIGGGGTIMGTSPLSVVGGYLPGAAGSALNTGLSTGLMTAGIGKLTGMSTQDALKMGLVSGGAAGAMAGLKGTSLDPAGGTKVDTTSPVTGADGAPVTAATQVPGGAPGATGTAADLLSNRGSGLGMKFDVTPSSSNAYDLGGGSASPALGSGPSLDASARGSILGESGAGYRVPSTPMPAPGSSFLNPGTNVALPGNNYSLVAPPAAPAPAPNMLQRALTGVKDIYGEYLSPERPGLAKDAGLFTRYAPLALAGTAAASLAGGMKSDPADQAPAFDRSYTGMDYMRDNPNKFSGGLSSYTRPSVLESPIVPTPSYANIPTGAPSVNIPTGISNQPSGVNQPYNVAGLYGVPLIYGPDGLPRNYAKGGAAKSTEFPRKNGPINGPGTGTSDDIPAMLSDGEFVFTARSVRNAGGGSRRKGAARMYKLMKMLEGGPVKGK